MAYAAFSVVFGEQPSAAKWNILGTNDSSFNDATGTPSVVKGVNRQDIAANSVVTNQQLQSGWTYVTGDGVNKRESVTITFPVAFDSAPVVTSTSIGVLVGSNPDSIDDFNASIAGTAGDLGWLVSVHNVSTTGCVLTINDTATLTSTWRLGLSWIAVGTITR